MGKKRIAAKGGPNKSGNALKSRTLSRGSKRKLTDGVLQVQSTYNNTRVSVADADGNIVFTSSAGALGFKGAKKGTPFAAAKVGELIGEQAMGAGLKEVDIVVKGVGAGRESAIRSFVGKGINIRTIQDKTPVPHNGPKAPKPRRV
jgi:small subunit ribosomal protein S11